MDDILEDRKEMEEAVDGINIDFEIAAFVASIGTMDDIQLSLSYVKKSSTQDIAGEVTFEDIDDEKEVTFKDIDDKEKLDESIQDNAALGWKGFSD